MQNKMLIPNEIEIKSEIKSDNKNIEKKLSNQKIKNLN